MTETSPQAARPAPPKSRPSQAARGPVVRTLPTAISLARVASIAAIALNPELLGSFGPAVGLLLLVAVYWGSDVLDGAVARRLGVDSQIGENVDLMADRACDLCLSLAVITAGSSPEAALAAVFVVVRFAPDHVVGRSLDRSRRAYAGLLETFGLPSPGPLAARVGLEAVHLARAAFFAHALVPGLELRWTLYLFAGITIGFGALALTAALASRRSEA